MRTYRWTIPKPLGVTEFGRQEKVRILCYNSYVELRVLETNTLYRAHFKKNVYQKEELNGLREALVKDQRAWETMRDKRSTSEDGRRRYITTGHWCAQGQCTPLDPVYPAGKAGKLEKRKGSKRLLEALSPFAKKASDMVRKYRPDVWEKVRHLPFPFDTFHLFMAPQGDCGYHQDEKDYLACLFPINVQEGPKGGLELPALKIAFKWNVGDLILLDGKALEHGPRDYSGETEERMMGIFIIQRPFLIHHQCPL